MQNHELGGRERRHSRVLGGLDAANPDSGEHEGDPRTMMLGPASANAR